MNSDGLDTIAWKVALGSRILSDATRWFSVPKVDPPPPSAPAPQAAEVDWGCCDDPRPRVSDADGRFFCVNCLLYLDSRPDDPPTEGDPE